MSTTLRFNPRGGIDCLYTEAVDLRTLGRLHVVRATGIAFDPEEQRWEVRCATSDELLFANPSRATCLAWEKANLQPGTHVPSFNNPTTNSIMKKTIIVIIALVAILAACGPDKSKLRTELHSIDAELVQIQTTAGHYRDLMSAAEFDAFIGSLAAGYGTLSGDYELAGDGVDTAVHSVKEHGTSRASLDQLKRLHDQLAARRAEIVSQLD